MSDSPDTPYNAGLAAAVAKITPWLARLIEPEQVVEIRALHMHDGSRPAGQDGGIGYARGSGSTWAGTFLGSELDLIAEWALKLSALCSGVYYTLNPLRPGFHTRQAPRVQRITSAVLASDADVVERRWLLVDVDPVKPAGHRNDSATDAEKTHTLALAGRVREYLAAEGWPAPILSDSGNGHHLLYRLAEPYPVDSAALPIGENDPIRRLLRHLAERFDGPDGTIDTAVFNPARIVKLPGTMACKGPASEDRPHRRARVLEIPE